MFNGKYQMATLAVKTANQALVWKSFEDGVGWLSLSLSLFLSLSSLS
jgi:hypothetical protein